MKLVQATSSPHGKLICTSLEVVITTSFAFKLGQDRGKDV